MIWWLIWEIFKKEYRLLIYMTTLNMVVRAHYEALSKEERDKTLMRDLHLTADDLAQIRTPKRVIDRVLSAAEILRDRLRNAEYDARTISAQFSVTNLGYMIDSGEFSTHPEKLVQTALKRHYRDERKKTQGRVNFVVPGTQFLRDEVGVSGTNLFRAKEVWPEIGVSKYDLLRDIRLPLSIGLMEAILLGVVIGDGNILGMEKRKKRYRLELWGRNDDFELYDLLLDPLFLDIFNCDLQELESSGGKDKNGVTYTYNIPGRIISSKAIMTWLTEHLDLSIDRSHKQLPSLLTYDPKATKIHKKGLFMGLVASEARIYSFEEEGRIRWKMQIHSSDRRYLTQISQLANTLRYDSRINGRSSKGDRTSYYLSFSPADIVDMLFNGLFINPRHVLETIPLMLANCQPTHVFDRLDPAHRDFYDRLVVLYNCGVHTDEIHSHLDVNLFHDSLGTDALGSVLHAGNLGYRVVHSQGVLTMPLEPVCRAYDELLLQQESA